MNRNSNGLRKIAAALLCIAVVICTGADVGAITEYGAPNFCNLVVFARFKPEGDTPEQQVDTFNAGDNWSKLEQMFNYNGGTYTDVSFKNYIYTVSEGNVIVNNYFPQLRADKKGVNTFTLSLTEAEYNSDVTFIGEIIAALNNGAIPLDSGVRLDYRQEGVLDNLTIVIKGKGAINDQIYPHKANYPGTETVAGKSVVCYNVIDSDSLVSLDGTGSHIGNKQGVLSHEFLHTLGLPDLYRYNDSGKPVGIWDIMGSTSPYQQYPLSYMRSLLGWIDLPELTEAGSYTLTKTSLTTGNRGFIIKSPLKADQFFVVEYRVKNDVGAPSVGYDTKLPASGMLIYRVDNSLEHYSNSGADNYIYIFRPNPTSIGGAQELDSLNAAPYGIEADEKSYGSTDLHAAYNENTLYYADGTNSGIMLSNMSVSEDKTQMSFELSFSDYGSLDLWEDVSPQSAGYSGSSIQLAVDPSGDSPTIYAVTQPDEFSLSVRVKRTNGAEWTTVGSDIPEVYNSRIIFWNNKLYLAAEKRNGNLELYSLNGGVWNRYFTATEETWCASSQFFAAGEQLYCAYVSDNEKLYIRNALTGALIDSSLTAGYFSNPSLCAFGNDIYVIYADADTGAAEKNCVIAKYDGSKWTQEYTSTLSGTNQHSLVSDGSALYAAVISGIGSTALPQLISFDGAQWAAEDAPQLDGENDLTLMLSGSSLYAAVTSSGSARVFRKTARGFEQYGHDVATNVNYFKALISGGTIYAASSASNSGNTVIKKKEADAAKLVTAIALTSDADVVVKGGTLQLAAEVLPSDAEDASYTWSVVNDTGSATISAGGLLTATGWGTVRVRATANDGSEVFGEREITVMPVYGDLCVDDALDIKDAVLLKRHIDTDAELNNLQTFAADYNRDGAVDKKDLESLLSYIAEPIAN